MVGSFSIHTIFFSLIWTRRFILFSLTSSFGPFFFSPFFPVSLYINVQLYAGLCFWKGERANHACACAHVVLGISLFLSLSPSHYCKIYITDAIYMLYFFLFHFIRGTCEKNEMEWYKCNRVGGKKTDQSHEQVMQSASIFWTNFFSPSLSSRI